MRLPFRYQFVLAPVIIAILLALLVAYTFVELAGINRANDATRRWEVVTDRIQVAIAGAIRLKQITQKLSSIKDLKEHDDYFDYVEKTERLSNNLVNQYLLHYVSANLAKLLKENAQLLKEPDKTQAKVINISLSRLIPPLEHQYKLFASKRRTAYMNNHHSLLAINSRMTTVLLTVLLLCIVLAVGVGLWSLKVMRSRLRAIAENASEICVEQGSNFKESNKIVDELDELEAVLRSITNNLVNSAGAEKLLTGAENERRRIAMDMHDGVLVDLTAINRNLDNLGQAPRADSKEQEMIEQLRSEVDQVINNLRCTIDDLHPQALEILGLEAALRSFLTRHSDLKGFPNCHLEYDSFVEKSIRDFDRINLFRIAIEAINNALKHAQCDRIDISVRHISNRVLVTVEDNGIGLSEVSNNNLAGHGLANIRERAKMMGAIVVWRSSRFSTGTCFELTLDVKRGEERG